MPKYNKVSVQFSLVAQSCPTLWDPMNHSTPGLPVHHLLPEFTQTHVHQVSDAIQPSHPLSPPLFLALSLAGQSIGASTSVLLINIQGWFPLGLTGLMSLQSRGLSKVFFSMTVWKHQILMFKIKRVSKKYWQELSTSFINL